MNYLVILDTQAGELEKILSGVKTMVVKEFDPARDAGQGVSLGDSLYFLRNTDECAPRVKATVVRVLPLIDSLTEDLSNILKEMQPKLQLTEDQYNYWSAKKQVLLVEINTAHKVAAIQITPDKVSDRSDWIAFEEFGLVSQDELNARM